MPARKWAIANVCPTSSAMSARSPKRAPPWGMMPRSTASTCTRWGRIRLGSSRHGSGRCGRSSNAATAPPDAAHDRSPTPPSASVPTAPAGRPPAAGTAPARTRRGTTARACCPGPRRRRGRASPASTRVRPRTAGRRHLERVGRVARRQARAAVSAARVRRGALPDQVVAALRANPWLGSEPAR